MYETHGFNLPGLNDDFNKALDDILAMQFALGWELVTYHISPEGTRTRNIKITFKRCAH